MSKQAECYSKVYIVESPAAVDLLEKRTEGKALSSILSLSDIDHEYYLAVNKKCFKKAFHNIRKDVQRIKAEYKDVKPCIHISCHSDEESISLTNNKEINWHELSDILSEVNEVCDENPLCLLMSSCCGLSAYVAIKEIDGKSPKTFIVGSDEEVGWDTSLIAFASFYFNYIGRGISRKKAVECMNMSINNEITFTTLK